MVQYKSARFYNWEEIDSMLRKWGSGHFPSGGVYAAGERDENSFAIWLKYLLPEDKEKFQRLVKDSDEDTPENAWHDATNPDYPELPYSLPEDVSLKVMGDLIGMQVDVECAMYEGVYFFTE